MKLTQHKVNGRILRAGSDKSHVRTFMKENSKQISITLNQQQESSQERFLLLLLTLETHNNKKSLTKSKKEDFKPVLALEQALPISNQIKLI